MLKTVPPLLISKVILFALSICLSACDPWFSYSPYEANLDEPYVGTNARNLARLQALGTEEALPFKVALLADTHYHFGKLEDAISDINARDDFTFAIVVGDLTENGLKQEFVLFHRLMSRLKIPYVTTIGNHDYLANGERIYTQMFGPYNYTFEYNNVKFILFDNTTIESGKRPDIEWFAAQLKEADNYEYTIPVSHIPPYDAQMADYHRDIHELLRGSNIDLSIHGHRHHFSVDDVYGDGSRYVTVSSPQYRTYTELAVSPAGLSIKKIEF